MPQLLPICPAPIAGGGRRGGRRTRAGEAAPAGPVKREPPARPWRSPRERRCASDSRIRRQGTIRLPGRPRPKDPEREEERRARGRCCSPGDPSPAYRPPRVPRRAPPLLSFPARLQGNPSEERAADCCGNVRASRSPTSIVFAGHPPGAPLLVGDAVPRRAEAAAA